MKTLSSQSKTGSLGYMMLIFISGFHFVSLDELLELLVAVLFNDLGLMIYIQITTSITNIK